MSPANRRFVLLAVAGALAGVVVALVGPWQLALLAGWNAATIAYLVAVWSEIGPADGAATRQHSTIDDDSRALRGLIVVAAGLMSLAGAGVALHKSARAEPTWEQVTLVAGAILAVVASWLSVNTDFTLRYAHLYYSEPEGGVDFPGVDAPSYADFAYLSFTIGMTYQVSDTGLLTPTYRRVLLKHALLSYLFGAVIIASVINVVAGLL